MAKKKEVQLFAQHGLRYKLLIAFSLMSVIPLLILGYLVTNYIFPHLETLETVSLVVLIAIFIALMGFILAKRLVYPVIEMAMEARIIASGDVSRKINVKREDEIGALGSSINRMTQTIKDNMNELSLYGRKTKDLNMEIHKKVLTLSSLLQVGDAMSTAAKLDDILSFITAKVSQSYESGYSLLLLPAVEGGSFTAHNTYNYAEGELRNIKLRIGEGLLGKLLKDKEMLIVDDTITTAPEVKELMSNYHIKNAVFCILGTAVNAKGILIAGNDKRDFKYSEDDIELINIFAKQISIAIENDRLMKEAKSLAVRDELTGLYNKGYIEGRLDEEIKRAIFCQRPCSYAILHLDQFDLFRQKEGELAAEAALKRIADTLEKSMEDLDKAARIAGDEFAIVMPERNKKEAAKFVEELKKKVINTSVKGRDGKAKIDLSASTGLSENPIDGTTAKELTEKAAIDLKG